MGLGAAAINTNQKREPNGGITNGANEGLSVFGGFVQWGVEDGSGLTTADLLTNRYVGFNDQYMKWFMPGPSGNIWSNVFLNSANGFPISVEADWNNSPTPGFAGYEIKTNPGVLPPFDSSLVYRWYLDENSSYVWEAGDYNSPNRNLQNFLWRIFDFGVGIRDVMQIDNDGTVRVGTGDPVNGFKLLYSENNDPGAQAVAAVVASSQDAELVMGAVGPFFGGSPNFPAGGGASIYINSKLGFGSYPLFLTPGGVGCVVNWTGGALTGAALDVQGNLSTAAGAIWDLGAVVVAASAFDGTRHVAVNINGVAVKLAVCV